MRATLNRVWDIKKRHMIYRDELFERIGSWLIKTVSYSYDCEYTTASDYKGTPIFQDDIVQVLPKRDNIPIQLGVIRWINFSWKVHCIDRLGIEEIFDINQFSLKVLGNIHEHPEILKNRKKLLLLSFLTRDTSDKYAKMCEKYGDINGTNKI